MHLSGDIKTYDITNLDEEKDREKTFYKERWIKEDGLEQKLIVTYSIKYRDYQRKIRKSQIEHASKVIDTNPTKIKKCNQNDYKRFISKTSITLEGEIANKELYSIDTELIYNRGSIWWVLWSVYEFRGWFSCYYKGKSQPIGNRRMFSHYENWI